MRHRKHRGMPPKNSGPARGGGAAAARALDGAGQSVASQISGAQTGKALVQPSPPRSEKSWGGAPRTHSGIAAKGKGAASSEKPPSVDELVDELSALVAMHKRSPLQLQELHSSLQAVTAKAAAAEKVAAEKEKVAVEKAAVEKAAAEKAAAVSHNASQTRFDGPKTKSKSKRRDQRDRHDRTQKIEENSKREGV